MNQTIEFGICIKPIPSWRKRLASSRANWQRRRRLSIPLRTKRYQLHPYGWVPHLYHSQRRLWPRLLLRLVRHLDNHSDPSTSLSRILVIRHLSGRNGHERETGMKNLYPQNVYFSPHHQVRYSKNLWSDRLSLLNGEVHLLSPRERTPTYSPTRNCPIADRNPSETSFHAHRLSISSKYPFNEYSHFGGLVFSAHAWTIIVDFVHVMHRYDSTTQESARDHARLPPDLRFRIAHLNRSFVSHRQDHMRLTRLLLPSRESIGHPEWGIPRSHSELLPLLGNLLQSLVRLHPTRRLAANPNKSELQLKR